MGALVLVTLSSELVGDNIEAQKDLGLWCFVVGFT